MKTQEVKKLFEDYVIGNYKRLDVCLIKGKGSRVWDLEGKEYIDFFPGWAVSGLGHCHPKIVSAVKNQAKKIIHISNNFLNLKQGQLAQEIIANSFPGKVFFCNSGAEAVEGAIKFARKWGSSKGRSGIITMKGSFHGRTLGAMTATGQGRIHEDFPPIPEGFSYAEFNNLKSVESLITDKTAAVMLETVQGEGGIQIPTESFMRGLRELTREKGVLLIVDEVQSGIARTGKMFAYQHFDIEPDVMTLAKALGGGVPIGALVVNASIRKDVFTPGSHGSTYGGNPLVAAGSLAVFKAIKDENIIQYVNEQLAPLLREKLEVLKGRYPFIKDVRAMGVMCGVELTIPGTPIVEKCQARGLLINCTQEKILRIIPACNISKKLLMKGLHILNKVLSEVKES